MADTTYEVQLRYGIESRGAESGLGVLAARAQEAEKSMLSLRGTLNTITAVASAAAAALGFYKASDALIGYNARLEQTQITMQQIAAVNLRTGFDQAEAPVARYVSLLREAARLSPGTQQDFFSVGQDILG